MSSKKINNQNISSYERQSTEIISTFWIVQHTLYLKAGSSLYEIDLQTKKKTEIIKNMANDNLSYVDGKIFYINNKYLLEIYFVDTQTSTEINTHHVSACYALEQQVLIQTMDGEMIVYSLDDSSTKKLCETTGTLKNADENYFYCLSDEKIIDKYSVSDGRKCDTIYMDYNVVEIKSSTDGKNIYIATHNGTDTVYQCYTNE